MFNSCHSERSRGISRYSLRKVRDISTSLDMTTRVIFAFLIAIWASATFAQESPTPIPSPTVEESLSPSIRSEERRVGKECRYRGTTGRTRDKEKQTTQKQKEEVREAT